MNPTGRFSNRADLYAQHRPSYPAAAVDALLEDLVRDSARGLRAADVGAGTGISARLLADRGVFVWAVEPNAEMRAMAAPSPLVAYVAGTAEATGLADESVELVLCAQAFHWFRADEALREMARILTSGGRVALMWNVRDRSDAATAQYGSLLKRSAGELPAVRRQDAAKALADCPLFRDSRMVRFPHSQALTVDGLIGRALSASYAPLEGPARAELEAGLRELHDQHAGADGRLRLAYATEVYLAEKSV